MIFIRNTCNRVSRVTWFSIVAGTTVQASAPTSKPGDLGHRETNTTVQSYAIVILQSQSNTAYVVTKLQSGEQHLPLYICFLVSRIVELFLLDYQTTSIHLEYRLDSFIILSILRIICCFLSPAMLDF